MEIYFYIIFGVTIIFKLPSPAIALLFFFFIFTITTTSILSQYIKYIGDFCDILLEIFLYDKINPIYKQSQVSLEYENKMRLPLVCNSFSNASGKRCRKTSPNNAPTAKLKRIFKVPPFSATRKIKLVFTFRITMSIQLERLQILIISSYYF